MVLLENDQVCVIQSFIWLNHLNVTFCIRIISKTLSKHEWLFRAVYTKEITVLTFKHTCVRIMDIKLSNLIFAVSLK